MTPKEYFLKKFDNAISDYPESAAEWINNIFPTLFSSELLHTDFLYSNDYVFNQLVEDHIINSHFHLTDPIYVGKLGNLMPNCYNVNSDDIDGCLVCYTTGMSENVNLFAQAIVALYMGSSLDIKPDVLTLYKDLLMLELERRIHKGYGGPINTNILVDVGMDFLSEDNITDLLYLATMYSYVMDLVLILHEIGHYWVHSTKKSINLFTQTFVLKISKIYVNLCDKVPELKSQSPDEIYADLYSLLFLADGEDIDPLSIILIFASFLQLNKMSANDNYTNEHRLKVVRYFFKDNQVYNQSKDSIEGVVNLLLDIFEKASADSYDEKTLLHSMNRTITSILKVSSLTKTQKLEIINHYLEIEEKKFKSMLEDIMEEVQLDTNSSDFEEL